MSDMLFLTNVKTNITKIYQCSYDPEKKIFESRHSEHIKIHIFTCSFIHVLIEKEKKNEVRLYTRRNDEEKNKNSHRLNSDSDSIVIVVVISHLLI